MPSINLVIDDAVELAELLQFINYWLASDHNQLHTSLLRYVGHPSYDINRLQADLARFTLLLGGDTDGDLVQPPPTQ
jgi:hypothetical protein